MRQRPSRNVTLEGNGWLFLDTGRTASGLGLGYFLRRDGDTFTSDRTDRRCLLDPGLEIAGLTEGDVDALWENAVALTPTERRLEDREGRLWLARGSGPVWSEGGAADGVGVQLSCLTEELPVVEVRGVRVPDVEDADLLDLLPA